MGDLSGRILGHYRVVERIGAGGMGEVYRAHDERLERDVAIKVLPDRVAEDPDRMKRFEREAKVLASLNHPNIATLFGLEEHESSSFLVMELVEGESLDAVIARGALPTEEAVTLAIDIARALESAHERGVIHRDLKPANVMIDSEGHVKVLDFGLAKAFDPSEELPRSVESIAESPTLTAELTLEGALLGTAAYMCPEQAQGKPVDRRCDVWAFGCVLFEMLTGDRPFHGTSSTDVAAAILKDEPDWSRLPSDTPAPVRRMLRRCLTKDRRDRLHDVADARIELESVASGEHLLEGTSAAAAVAGPGWLTWILTVTAFALILGVLGIVVLAGRVGDEQSEARTFRAVIDLPAGTALPAGTLSRESSQRVTQPIRNDVAVSPNGTVIVFSAAPDRDYSTAQLYRRRLDEDEAVSIPGTEGASGPFFSPDGQWIAFWADGEIKKVRVGGGLPVTLMRYEDQTAGASLNQPHMGGSWSPDGNLYIGTHLEGILRVDEAGGDPEALTTPDPQKEYAHRLPHVLPGGRALLFTAPYSWDGADGHIEVLSLDSGERKIVLSSGLDGRYVASGHLVYLDHGTMMAAPFDHKRLELTGRPVPVVQGIAHATNAGSGWRNPGCGTFAVSQTGTLVYAPGGIEPEYETVFTRVSLDGQRHSIAGPPAGWKRNPRLSPDGTQLAYATRGLQAHVWLHDLERATTRRLTDEGRVVNFSWNPNGDGLVVGLSRGGVANLYMVSLTGTVERLSESPGLQQPGSWSPDGLNLAYVQWGQAHGWSVWVLDMTDRSLRPMFEDEDGSRFPEISPDGHWLLYTSQKEGDEEVWISSFPRAHRQFQVSNNGGIAPAWSPDGQKIYYLDDGALWVVDFDTTPSLALSRPRKLLEGSISSGAPIRSYDVALDGESFIVADTIIPTEFPRQITRLNIVVNWFDELDRLIPTE